MSADHAEIWIQAPPAPVQNLDALIHNPSPDQDSPHQEQKVASDDLLVLGMMLWMEQGLVLEWLRPAVEEETEGEPQPKRRCC